MPPQSSETTPRVGVVTVAYRSDDVLPTFLGSLSGASHSPLAVVIADNLPTQGAARAHAATAGAQYAEVIDNPGYGAAINRAVALLPSSVEWVLISNPDVVLGAAAVDILVATGDSAADIAAVGPAILGADGALYPSARAVPSLRTGIGHALFANLWQSNPWTAAYLQDSARASEIRDAGWLSGACVLVRRTVFDELGGFDEGYFMYFEDVDLGYRIGRIGYRNVFDPAATALHTGAHSTSGESARMIEAHHASARRFLDRKYPGPLLWPVRFVLNAGLRIRSAALRRRVSG